MLPRGEGEAVAVAQVMHGTLLATAFRARKLRIALQRARCHFFLASEMSEAHLVRVQ
jgi:hypothetical protein